MVEMRKRIRIMRGVEPFLPVPFYFARCRNRVVSPGYRLSRGGLPAILTPVPSARERSRNRGNARFTFEIRLAIVDGVSIARNYPVRGPLRATIAPVATKIASYRELAISRVRGVFERTEKEKKGGRKKRRDGGRERARGHRSHNPQRQFHSADGLRASQKSHYKEAAS